MNSLPHDAQNSEAPHAASCADQEINIIAVSNLGCERAGYWTRRAQAQQAWMAAGGFEQEAAPVGTPSVSLKVLPSDPVLENFYAASSRIIARAAGAARDTLSQQPRANDF